MFAEIDQQIENDEMYQVQEYEALPEDTEDLQTEVTTDAILYPSSEEYQDINNENIELAPPEMLAFDTEEEVDPMEDGGLA